ncbi:MAG: hypothetical protein IKT88_00300, partial [Lachnospiraceae bacterium]|nr:hypothetical protein [Lachnospiraceae bacterium]
TAKDTTNVVVGISFSAKCLYTGDDVDIIPSTKKAVAVAIHLYGKFYLGNRSSGKQRFLHWSSCW